MIVQPSLGELSETNYIALRYYGLFYSIASPMAYCCIAKWLREASTFHFSLYVFHSISRPWTRETMGSKKLRTTDYQLPTKENYGLWTVDCGLKKKLRTTDYELLTRETVD